MINFFKKGETYILLPFEENRFKGIKIVSSDKAFRPEKIELSVKELKGKNVFLVLNTKNFIYEHTTLTLAHFHPEVLKFQLKRNLQNMAFFEGEFEIFFKVYRKEQKDYFISYFAIDKKEIAKYKELLTNHRAKLKGITHLALIPFSFLETQTGFPLVIIYEEGNLFWFFLVDEEKIERIDFYEIDEFLGFNSEEVFQRVQNFAEYSQRIYQSNIKEIKFFGERKEHFKSIEEALKDGWIFSLEAKENFLRKTLEIPDDFNFLPEKERFYQEFFKYWASLGVVFLIFSLGFTGGALWFKSENKKTSQKINREYSQILSYVNQINQMVTQESLNRIKKYMFWKEALFKNPSLVRVFTFFSNYLPENSKIEKFKLENDQNNCNLEMEITFKTSERNFNKDLLGILSKINKIVEISQKNAKFDSKKEEGLIEIKGTCKDVF